MLPEMTIIPPSGHLYPKAGLSRSCEPQHQPEIPHGPQDGSPWPFLGTEGPDSVSAEREVGPVT